MKSWTGAKRAHAVIGERYVHMLENILARVLAHLPDFQQDGATSLTAAESLRAVRNLFLIMLSPDMGISDGRICQRVIFFFLCGYLKSKVFTPPPPYTIQELKHRIQEEIELIPVEMLQRVMSDVRRRLAECVQRNVGHLEEVIFGR